MTESKQEFFAKRLKLVNDAYDALRKLDVVSKAHYKSQAPSIRQLYPFIPQKLVDSIGFGDGKTRKRHHSRCFDSIRIGEICI